MDCRNHLSKSYFPNIGDEKNGKKREKKSVKNGAEN